MSGISDHPFRHIQKKYGKPALVYTEFTSVERLTVGDRDLLKDFQFDESQRPVVAQIYGLDPDLFRRMAIMLCELGFDGIDINMGCPAPSVVYRGSGAGLINSPRRAQEIIKATKLGVEQWCNGARLRDDAGVPRSLVADVEARVARLPAHYPQRRMIPISVKTRIGYDSPQVRDWIPQVLECEPAAIAIHGRTLRQAYGGSADWDEIAIAAELARPTSTLLLGNGDIKSLAEGKARSAEYGVDGFLIGRGSYGNPFVFREEAANMGLLEEKYHLLQIMLEHAHLYEDCYGARDNYRFLPMRKHLTWYVRSLPSANHLRRELVHTFSPRDVEAILQEYLHRSGHTLAALGFNAAPQMVPA